MKKPIPILSMCLMLFVSCSVQKRKYQNGFYVDWHSKSSHPEKTASAAEKFSRKHKITVPQEYGIATGEDQTVTASAEKHAIPLRLKKQVAFAKLDDDTCDVLVYKDGSEIRVKVHEVGINEIKYKRCDALDGPMYISRKSELFMIKYANGTREVIKSELPEVKTQQPDFNRYKTNKYRKQNHPLSLVALIFGILGLVVGYICLILLIVGAGPGVLVLPFIAGLIAVLAGRTALNRIREQPDVYKGKGMAMPGFIMGTVVLGILALIGFLAFLL